MVLAAFALGALLTPLASSLSIQERDVDTRFPYKGPKIPIGDWVDPTVNGNGKGYPRLHELPAVTPKSDDPKNNVNVISVSYIPNGVNIHFQTPFGLGQLPHVNWGTKANDLRNTAKGQIRTYDRTPPCSKAPVTQCSQVQIPNLKPDTTYFYEIPAMGGTTKSDVLSFKTARSAGDTSSFTMAILNDMGYTNAMGTFKQLNKATEEGIAFVWHGGDLSYADDWYSGITPCESSWPVCYNGSSSEIPGPTIPKFYKDHPLPAGEVPTQGGPLGGDSSVLYESTWDLWQQWLNKVTMKVPYMTLAGNHEAACAEFDGPGNFLTAYLNDDESNSTAPEEQLTYYSCPPSQRNFTAYQNRFRMPGAETGGVGNFWYSFDYGLVHFVSINTETDFAFSPEFPFVRDVTGNETLPAENETFPTDSGPFGRIDDNNFNDNTAYEQYQWVKSDLAKVDRSKTPWIICMGHRPMYSTAVSSYQEHIRDAFEDLMLENGVDAYLSGHIHWYERLLPLGKNGTIDESAIVNNNTYRTDAGKSMTHIINGMAGNIESHGVLEEGEPIKNITAVLNNINYGFSKLTVHGARSLTFQFVRGDGNGLGDELTLLKGGNTEKRDPLGYE